MTASLLRIRLFTACLSALLLLGIEAAEAQNAGPAAQNGPAQSEGVQPPPQAGSTSAPQEGTPFSLKPDLPGMERNHRLILKDGSYQRVRQYQIIGDRVRYFSVERSDWEELPVSLVDWGATRKWEQAHRAPYDGNSPDNLPGMSPGMAAAAEVDREEAAIRNQRNARTPTVAPGLQLPDESGVFVLDTYHGTPELVPLPATGMSLNRRERHGLGVLNPMAGETPSVEIQGRHSRIHLHVNDPAIYLSLAAPDDNQPVLGHAMTVDTTGANAVNVPPGAQSARSRFAIVKVDERNTVRIVDPVRLNTDGSVVENGDVIAATGRVLEGKHWLLLKPDQPLEIGEYALIEILSPTEISPTVWDFRVDPTKGDNLDAITPILPQADQR